MDEEVECTQYCKLAQHTLRVCDKNTHSSALMFSWRCDMMILYIVTFPLCVSVWWFMKLKLKLNA